MNYITANRKAPKANDPKWLNIALLALFSIGNSIILWPGPYEKYHMQLDEAKINVDIAKINALVHSAINKWKYSIYLI